jgi:hypothetical protein
MLLSLSEHFQVLGERHKSALIDRKCSNLVSSQKHMNRTLDGSSVPGG